MKKGIFPTLLFDRQHVLSSIVLVLNEMALVGVNQFEQEHEHRRWLSTSTKMQSLSSKAVIIR
jgi:hypothetical protein